MTTVTVSRELLERCDGIFYWLSKRSVYATLEIKGIHDDLRAALAQPAQLTVIRSYTADMDKVRRDEKERGEKFLRDLEGGTT